ncbi:hypothetical protein BGX38DRAFT_679195 [Terfezia claveryi]|nr:hypothetical protein BGX38DRAFT_679195 [Terfezia claveryi]
MSSRRKGSATGLKAIVLTGLLLLSRSTSASFIEHSNHHVITEPNLISIPNSLRGHHQHGSHGHGNRHRARFLQKRTVPVVVEVPYSIWTGTFEALKRRVPASKRDSKTQTDNTGTSTDDSCTGVVCTKGYYCTTAGCCPNG